MCGLVWRDGGSSTIEEAFGHDDGDHQEKPTAPSMFYLNVFNKLAKNELPKILSITKDS